MQSHQNYRKPLSLPCSTTYPESASINERNKILVYKTPHILDTALDGSEE
jgi:hypothetical protein